MNPENSMYYSNRAETYIKLKKYENSLEDTKKAIALDPTNFKSRFRKGVSEFHLKDFKASKNTFTEILNWQNATKRELESVQIWLEKCEKQLPTDIKIEEKKNTSSNTKKVEKKNTKIEQNEENKNIQLSESFGQEHILVEKLKKEGNFLEAIKLCHKILEQRPNDFICLHNLGIMYLNANKPKRAAEYFEKSVNVNPSIEGYKKLAEACLESANYKKAAVVCKLASKAIEDTPENEPHLLDFTVTAASALFKDGELNTALQLVTNVLLKNDQHLNACILYGDILISKKSYTEALRIFIRSLLFNAKENRVKKRISQIVKIDNIDGLSGTQLLFKEIGEENTPSASLLVFFANMVKDYSALDQSKFLFEKSLQLDSSNVSILLNYVHLIELYGDYQAALSTIKEFFSKNGDLSYQNSLACKDLLPILEEIKNL